jgi:ubiquinone/menaquinone biosynthesis C-methylase UbiE
MSMNDISIVIQHYDRLANTYDRRWHGYVRQTLERALAGLTLSGTERILDIGCGTGEFERMVIERFPGLAITGIDVSGRMISVACRKLAGQPQVRFEVARAEALPFGQETFDVVICASVLHHVREPQRVLQECVRVLRPGGKVVLIDWCLDFWHCHLMHSWLRLVDRTYVKMLRLAEVNDMLNDLGLAVDRACRFMAKPLYGIMWCVAEKIVCAPT